MSLDFCRDAGILKFCTICKNSDAHGIDEWNGIFIGVENFINIIKYEIIIYIT